MGELERIPTDLGHLQAGSGESLHLPGKPPEPSDTRRLLTRLEKKLVTQTDTQERTVGLEPVGERFPQTALAELVGAVAERTDAR